MFLSNFVGIRTHLELRSFIEDAIRNLEKGDDEEESKQNVEDHLAKLPQIYSY